MFVLYARAQERITRRKVQTLRRSGPRPKLKGFDYQAARQIVRPDLVRVLELDQDGGAP